MLRLARLAAAAAVLFVATAASAGLKSSNPVVVVTGGAFGALGTARNADDPSQYIGCSVMTIVDPATFVGSATVICSARDAAGTAASCFSKDPKIIQTAAAIASDSYVSFGFDANGVCTQLWIAASSYYAPKAP